MNVLFTIVDILLAVTLIGLILLQNSKGGLGSAFGGGDVYRTKRGAEKIVFTSTIVVAFLFLVTSLLTVAVQ